MHDHRDFVRLLTIGMISALTKPPQIWAVGRPHVVICRAWWMRDRKFSNWEHKLYVLVAIRHVGKHDFVFDQWWSESCISDNPILEDSVASSAEEEILNKMNKMNRTVQRLSR